MALQVRTNFALPGEETEWFAELGDRLPDGPPTGISPSSLTLDLTHSCPFSCPGCIERRAMDHSGRSELSLTSIKRILKRFAEAGGKEVLFYGGEPTLSRSFPSAVRYASSLLRKVRIVTNGSLLRSLRVLEPIVEAARRSEVRVRVSLNAGSAATHERLHQVRGFFCHVVEGMSLLVEAAGSEILEVSYLVEEDNAGELLKGYQIARSVGARDFWVRPKTGLHSMGLEPLSEAATRTLLEMIGCIEDNGGAGAPRFHVPGWYRDFLEAGKIPYASKGYPNCYFCAASRLVVSPPDPGVVWACTYFRSSPRFLVARLEDVPFGSAAFEKLRLEAILRIRPAQDCRDVICNRDALNRKAWEHLWSRNGKA